MTIHRHVKCPRCHVALSRQDTICWACRHVVKPPGMYIKYVWVWTSLEVAVGILAVVMLVKYRTQVQGVVQESIRSILKPH